MKSYSLRPGQIAALAALGAVIVAVAIGSLYGIALSVLLLASCALGLVIALLWSSVRNLTGDTPLSLDEALGLGAPSPEEEQKRAVLRALKDLEYERSVGKISEDDYREYSARYREEARRLMERVDASLAQARELAEKLLNERVAAAGLAAAKSEPSSEEAKAAKLAPAPPVSAPGSKTNEGEDEPDSEDEDEDEDEDEPDSEDAPDSEDEAEDEDEDEAEDEDEDEDEADGEDAPDTERDSDAPVEGRLAADPTNGPPRAGRCAACAGANDADAKFCKHCGAALDGAARALPAKRARQEKTS